MLQKYVFFSNLNMHKPYLLKFCGENNIMGGIFFKMQ